MVQSAQLILFLFTDISISLYGTGSNTILILSVVFPPHIHHSAVISMLSNVFRQTVLFASKMPFL